MISLHSVPIHLLTTILIKLSSTSCLCPLTWNSFSILNLSLPTCKMRRHFPRISKGFNVIIQVRAQPCTWEALDKYSVGNLYGLVQNNVLEVRLSL